MQVRQLVFILLCVVTFFVPWEEMLFIPGFGTVIFGVSGVALVLAVFEVISRARMRRLPLALLLLGIYVYWALLSYVWSADPDATQVRVITYVSLLLFTWMIWEYVDSRPRLLWLLRSYLLGCCVNLMMLFEGFATFRTVFSGGAIEGQRFGAGKLDVNTLACILAIGVVMAAYMATSTDDRWRTAYWLFLPAASIGILLTGSRSGAIGLAISLFFAFLISGSRSVKSMIPFLVVLGFAVWLIPDIVPSSLLQRVAEGTESSTFVVRQTQWRLGLEMWSESPVTGVGSGAFVEAAASRGGRALVAHNTFIQILAENGVVGLAIMMTVWSLLAVKVWRLPRQERLLWLGAGLVWAVSAMALSLEYYKITWFLYAWVMVQQPVAFPRMVQHGAAADVPPAGSEGLPRDADGDGRASGKEVPRLRGYGEASWS